MDDFQKALDDKIGELIKEKFDTELDMRVKEMVREEVLGAFQRLTFTPKTEEIFDEEDSWDSW